MGCSGSDETDLAKIVVLGRIVEGSEEAGRIVDEVSPHGSGQVIEGIFSLHDNIEGLLEV